MEGEGKLLEEGGRRGIKEEGEGEEIKVRLLIKCNKR